jgi:hypothetical protein
MTQEQVFEYAKCCADPVYFLNNYGYVFDLEKQKIDRLTLYAYQEPILHDFEKHRNNIVLKSRQQGLSVLSAGYAAYKLIFGEDERILVVANDAKGAIRFVESVKIFLDNCPEWMLPEQRLVDNQRELKFSNGCQIKAVSSSPQAGRGESLTLLILDEVAFIEHADSIWMGAGMALSVTGGKCIMISTPFGTGTLYHRTWVGAIKKENDFNPIKVHWSTHPILSRGLEYRADEFGNQKPWSPWYDTECKRFEYNNVKISQELDLSFEGSRNLVIDNIVIERFKHKLINPIDCYFDYLSQEGFVKYETPFYVWKKPEENHNYILAADISRGDGADYSTIEIIDAVTLEQVAEYQGKVMPDEFANIIYQAGLVYNIAYVAAECNSFGLVTSLRLKNELNYPPDKIFHSKTAVQLYNKSWKVNLKKDDDIPGWQTTSKTRPIMISTLQRYMREGEVIINSERLLNEFQTFIYTTSNKNSNEVKAQHAPGYHDDLIFAFGIALVMRDTEHQNQYWSTESILSMIEGMRVETTQFNFQKRASKTNIDPNKDDDDDLNWLLSPLVG